MKRNRTPTKKRKMTSKDQTNDLCNDPLQNKPNKTRDNEELSKYWLITM
jgi:hypothetical protein